MAYPALVTAVAPVAPEAPAPGGVDGASTDLMTPWWGVLAVEGSETGDDREFNLDSLRWDLQYGPLPLRWCEQDFGAHDGAEASAWIDEVQRIPNPDVPGQNLIMGRGRIYDGEFQDHLEVAGRIGCSVDCDDETFQIIVPPEDVVPGPEGGTFEPAFQKQVFSDARIRGATAVDFGALIECYIVPGEPPTRGTAADQSPTADAGATVMAAGGDGSPGLQDVGAAAGGEATAAAPAPGDEGITHSGVCLTGADTGRILMLQRALLGPDQGEAEPDAPIDENAGLWEFPGGGIDPGETPDEGARREFAEETGVSLPADAQLLGQMDNPTDAPMYRLFVYQIPAEAEYPIDDRVHENPDDPDGDVTEALAWWDPAHVAAGGPNIRPEVAAMDWPGLEQIIAGNTQEAQPMDTVTAAAGDVPAAPGAPPADAPPPTAPSGDVTKAIDLLKQAMALVDSEQQDEIQEVIDALSGNGPEQEEVEGPDLAELDTQVGNAIRVLDNMTQGDDPAAIITEALGYLNTASDILNPGPEADETDNLIASAAPVSPPSEWFAEIDFAEDTPVTITPEGRVFGIFAPKNSCHAGDRYKGTCQPPPVDPNPEFFHLGQVVCADGAVVDVGRLTVGGGHADINLNMQAALEHYDNASTCVAVVHAYETRFGGAVVGSIVSDATPAQIAALRRSPVSGDWRHMPTRARGRRSKASRLIGIHAVNVPGFPMPRPGGQPLGLVASISPQAFVTTGRVVETCGECGEPEDGLVAAIGFRSRMASIFEADQNDRRAALAERMSGEITSEITEEGT